MSIKLLYAPQMAEMASDIYRLTKSTGSAELVHADWSRYPDGWSDAKVPNYKDLRHQDVVFLACFDSMDNTLEQIMLMSTLVDRFKVHSLKIILPYYPGMKDRWEKKGEVITGYALAQIMSVIPITRSGPADLVIYDIHAEQEEQYFPKNICVEGRSIMMAFNAELVLARENCCLALPDEGAFKRYKDSLGDWPKVVCEKRRVGVDRVIKIKEGDPQGMHVWIVDDIGMTCATMIKTKEALLRAGAVKVSAFFVHAVLPANAVEALLAAGFQDIWTTNSHPNAQQLKGMPGCRILSMADDILQAILEDYR